MKIKFEKIRDERYRYYENRCNDLKQHSKELDSSFDDKLVTISGGAIAISITFLGIFRGDVEYLWMIVGAWIFFGLTILGVLLSHIFVLKENIILKSKWDDWWQANIDTMPDLESQYRKLIPFTNHATSVVFFMGLIAYSTFVLTNMTQLDPNPIQDNEKAQSLITPSFAFRDVS